MEELRDGLGWSKGGGTPGVGAGGKGGLSPEMGVVATFLL